MTLGELTQQLKGGGLIVVFDGQTHPGQELTFPYQIRGHNASQF